MSRFPFTLILNFDNDFRKCNLYYNWYLDNALSESMRGNDFKINGITKYKYASVSDCLLGRNCL